MCARPIHAEPGEAVALHAAALRTDDWREVVPRPDVEIVTEPVVGTGVMRDIVEFALAAGKPVVPANKELLAGYGLRL